MAQRRRVSNTPYIYDNTARDLQIRRQMEEPRRQLSHETRKNREKARHMSIGYVTFLMVALVACAFFLVNYIQMQSELTARITEVSRMESELNSLKLANDEEYIMVDIQDCAGKFVGEIRQEYEKTIQDIINKCTIDEIYKKLKTKAKKTIFLL